MTQVSGNWWMQAEVNFLGQLHHPNLVKLIGYCSEDDQRLLVYEFMPRGSLENHLFRSESEEYMPLLVCVQITQSCLSTNCCCWCCCCCIQFNF